MNFGYSSQWRRRTAVRLYGIGIFFGKKRMAAGQIFCGNLCLYTHTSLSKYPFAIYALIFAFSKRTTR